MLAGVFDRFPDLQVIVGHWGELVLFHLDRIASLDGAAHLRRPIADYFRTNVFIAPSGMFSPRYLQWAIELVGVDRILFSTDHPFVPAQQLRGGILRPAPVSRETTVSCRSRW